jgi:hypothetical protein
MYLSVLLNLIWIFEEKRPPNKGSLFFIAITAKQNPEITAKIIGMYSFMGNYLL